MRFYKKQCKLKSVDENPHKQVKLHKNTKKIKDKTKYLGKVVTGSVRIPRANIYQNKDKSRLTKFEIDQLGVFARV